MIYIIETNLILVLLCLLFQVIMHRDTYFGIRRAMLMGIYAVAMLLPLWNVQGWMATQAGTAEMAEGYASYVLPTMEVTAQRMAFWGVHQTEPGCGMWVVGFLMLWGLVYLLPVVWLTAKLFCQVGYIIYLRFTCAHETVSGQRIYRYPRQCSPFSFGPWIFLPTGEMSETELREVLVHESTHVRQWHTFDILLSQLFCIAFWWNPATWVLRREVRLNLEFIADAAVVGRNADRRTYQYHLLGFASQMNVATLVNNFNVLPLKRRIIMMNATRTRRTGMLKYLLFVPVAAAVVLLCNIDGMARTLADNVKKPLMVVNGQRIADNGAVLSSEDIATVTVLQEESAKSIYGPDGQDGAIVIETNDGGDPIYEKVEVLPKYAEGDEAFFKALMQSVRYPAEAQDVGMQGRVMVQFVVEKDGTLTDVSVAKVTSVTDPGAEVVVVAYKPQMTEDERASIDARNAALQALKDEAVRAVKNIPGRWTPGMHEGKPVRVRFTLPVSFRLQ